MYEAEKGEIIETINEIRRCVGLRPYDEEQLSEMNVEELKDLYRRQLGLKESFEKPVKEVAREPKTNLKHVLLVVIPIVCIAFGLVFYFTIFKNLPEGTPSEEEGEEGGKESEEGITPTTITTAETSAADVSKIISDCNDMIDDITTINNGCVSNGDCSFTSFCNCVNAITYIDVEGLIEDSVCKDYRQADCAGLQCLCDNSECVIR